MNYFPRCSGRGSTVLVAGAPDQRDKPSSVCREGWKERTSWSPWDHPGAGPESKTYRDKVGPRHGQSKMLNPKPAKVGGWFERQQGWDSGSGRSRARPGVGVSQGGPCARCDSSAATQRQLRCDDASRPT